MKMALSITSSLFLLSLLLVLLLLSWLGVLRFLLGLAEDSEVDDLGAFFDRLELAFLLLLLLLLYLSLVGSLHADLFRSVFDFIEQTGDNLFDFFDVWRVHGFVEVGESVDLVSALFRYFEVRDVVVFDNAEIVDEDVDCLDELLDGKVLATWFVVIEEAVANEEMEFSYQSVRLSVFSLFLLRDDKAILVNCFCVFFVQHEEVSQSCMGTSQSIENVSDWSLCFSILGLFQLLLVDPDGELHVEQRYLFIIIFFLWLLLPRIHLIFPSLRSFILRLLFLLHLRILLNLRRLLPLKLILRGLAIIISLCDLIKFLLSLLMNIVRYCISIEDIYILLQFSNDEATIFIVEVGHLIVGLTQGVLCTHHQVVELFLGLVGRQLLHYREVGFEGLELITHLQKYFQIITQPALF